MTNDLARKKPVNGAGLLPETELLDALNALEGWILVDDGKAIEYRAETKNFAKAQILACLAGGIGEMANHHPDISFGWGYCTIRFTTHSAGGVTMNDLICAARFCSSL